MLCGAVYALPGAPAWAQASSLPPGQTLAQVLVTAQRREQDPLDVPIALTALPAAVLQALDVQTLQDVSLLAPGVFFQARSPNAPDYVIRGVSSNSPSATDEPRVSVFQDGAPISRSRGSFVELFDDRVEIARGPQTTLFGRNALIGAVALIDNPASEKAPDWNLRTEGGDFGYYDVEGMANLPLGDSLAVRVSGRYRRRDGYIDDALGGPAFQSVDTGAARLAVNWRPASRLGVDLFVNAQSDRPSGVAFKSETFYPSDPSTGARLGDLSPFTGAALATGPGFEGRPLGFQRDLWSATAQAHYQVDAALKLSANTAYRQFHSVETLDPDGVSLPLLTSGEDARGKQFSQELQANYDPGRRVSVLVGANAFYESDSEAVPLQVDERDLLALLSGGLDRRNPALQPQSAYTDPAYDAALLQRLAGTSGVNVSSAAALAVADNLSPDHQESYQDTNQSSAYDLYADTTVRPTDRLELSGGVRASFEHKTSGYQSQVLNGRSIVGGYLGALTLPPAIAGYVIGLLGEPGAATLPVSASYPIPDIGLATQPTDGRRSSGLNDFGVSGRLAALYRLSATQSLYATYAEGRRPQVLSAASPASPGGAAVFTDVAAETVNSYEIGAKGRWMGGRLSADAAAYYYDYTHFQTVVQSGVQFLTADAGRASTYGLELEARWAVTAAADLFGDYAYTHARFGSGLYDGNRFPLTPDNAFTLGGDAHRAVLGGLLTGVATYTWRSRTFFSDDNDNPALLTGVFLSPLAYNYDQGAYGLLNLRLGYQPGGAHWRLEGFVTNLTDTHFLRDAGGTSVDFGLPTYVAGEPRMYGASLVLWR